MATFNEKEGTRETHKCVSVGIFAQNCSNGLQESITSAINQEECAEVYVLFPPKINKETVEEYSKNNKDLRVNFIQDENANIIELANRVAASFKGEYFSFMNEEDIMSSHSLYTSVQILKQKTQYVLAHGMADRIDGRHGNRQSFRSVLRKEGIGGFARGSSMALATILIKRSAWLLLGGFDETVTTYYELDFAIRAYKLFTDRITFIERNQADVVCNFNEEPITTQLRKTIETYKVLKRNKIETAKFLEKSISCCIESLGSLSELKTFLDNIEVYLKANDCFDDVSKQIVNTLIDSIDINSMSTMEETGSTSYEEDGLAADLISCISLQMYSGYFANGKGRYATYESLRSGFTEEINYLKHLERCSLIVKGKKISSGFRDKPFGVNLIGHAFDVFGLGEALRMIARALINAKIPLNVIDIPASNGCARESNFLEDYVKTNFKGAAPYAFNIICMSPSSHAKWLLDGGLNLCIGRYSISGWFWETSTWPTPWLNLFQFVDAAWAFSSIIHKALSPHCKNNDIHLEKLQFPAEINIKEIQGNIYYKKHYRSKHNLPDDKIVFVFSFDPKSQVERKNPLACIRVFNDAFGDMFTPNYRDDVCLVIKTYKPEKITEEWENLISLTSLDKRIIIITGSMERSDLLGLYSCCDIFLSLHRSEGYGLGIAEALQLGLKVIVTNYGGNIDFCNVESAYLVDYSLAPIPRGSYPLALGHYWAEPDLKNAAKLCKKIVSEMSAQKTRASIPISIDHFSTSIAGKLFRKILEKRYNVFF